MSCRLSLPRCAGRSLLRGGPVLGLLALALLSPPLVAQIVSLDRHLQPLEERRQEDSRQLQAWLRRNAQPVSPGRTDLAPLARRLGSADVIGLGEVTHGSHEDMAFKAELVKALVEHQGVRVLALEANRGVGLRLQRFIDPASTERDVALALRESAIFSVYRCEALGELLLWLQAWNRSAATPVRVIGIDVQDPGRDTKAALAALAPLDAELALRLGQALQELRAERVAPVAQLFPQANRAQWQRWMGAATALEAALQRLKAADDALDAAYAVRMALHTFEFDVGTAGAPTDLPPEAFTRRDVAMAERLLRGRRLGERAVLWAHDTHVASNGYDVYAAQAPTVGKVLRERLGVDGYQALNFSYRQATFHAHGLDADGAIDVRSPFRLWRLGAMAGSLGAAMAATGLHSFWIDLGALPGERWALAFRQEPWRRLAFGDGVAAEQLAAADLGWPLGYGTDILVHLDTLTPSRFYPPAAREAKAP